MLDSKPIDRLQRVLVVSSPKPGARGSAFDARTMPAAETPYRGWSS